MLFHLLFGPRILWEGDGGGTGGGTGAGSGDGGQGGDGGQSGGQSGSQTGGSQQGDGSPGPVPYDRFKEINDQLKTANDRLAKIETDQKKTEEEQLKEQEKWKELAEKREQELETERLSRIRLEVAAKKGLPAALAGRLSGSTTEEMEKDADNLLQFMKPTEGPGVPPAVKGQGNRPLDFSKMSPEEIRKAAKGKAVADLV